MSITYQEIGRKIYFDRLTGNVIVDTGEMSGFVSPTTVDQDFVIYAALKLRDPSTVGLKQLQFGEYKDEFIAAIGVRVNPETLVLEFSFDQATQDSLEQKGEEESRTNVLEDVLAAFLGGATNTKLSKVVAKSIKRRMQAESLTIDDALALYPNLTTDQKIEVKNLVQLQ